ncbi:replication-associated recombination protein A [Porticoccaceae bacterium]|jgi:putative ATPase|nr:replication-associated recombination protein A [Porticoccaceae bacterium]MDA8941434.1 replication-associated recombination protein A [Porticoccaceae bacterium]MDB2395677.1 replication-associated recombination protein A [Porticoccaceae bacterium]MDB2400028.1 replication-associated recombination protein A [Porticoccaceae bacterium]
MSDDLFSQAVYKPLAARMRPDSLDGFYGQQHLIGPNRPLREAIDSGMLHSMIFWGPPGVGKTTLAKMIAHKVDAHFESISAVLSGVKEIRAAVAKAQEQRDIRGRKTILFVDEVHRFNKSQQDAFLPFVEDGTIVFVGATTENPSFELNNALLSRCRVYVLKSLTNSDIKTVVSHALADSECGLGAQGLTLEDEALDLLAAAADGDARRALNLLEIASDLGAQGSSGSVIDKEVLEQILVGDSRRFDKGGEYFYDQISALHKSIRGSSVDAGLYWLCRMLDGGCDPIYLARRLVRIANEDIGNADPRALELALNAWSVQERLGSPEGELALAQSVIYMAAAAKSNAVYSAFNAVMADVKSLPSYDVPLHLRNAPTSLMKDLDYGKDYRYAHNEEGAYALGVSYLPEELAGKQYYFPTDRGLEKKISKKLDYLRSLDDTGALDKHKDHQ